jgi:hypothetical protein
MVRHPIARTAVVGGVGFVAGSRAANRNATNAIAPPPATTSRMAEQQAVTLRITCPQGAGPGSQLQVEYNGAHYNVIIPAGVYAGQQFDVVIQPRAIPKTVAEAVGAAEVTPVAVPVATSARATSAAERATPLEEASTGANTFASANPFAKSSVASTEWAAASIKSQCDNQFQALGPSEAGSGMSLSPSQVSEALLPLGIPTSTLATIWELSDIDRDGRLDADEFCVAVFLCRQVAAGHELRSTLPDKVIPPSKRL